MVKFFKDYSTIFNEYELRHNIEQIDLDKSGKIDFGEFIVAMSDKEKVYARESLMEVFDHFDKDHTGYLDKVELKELLKGSEAEEIEFFLRELDTDQDNKISL